jgi:hypothetical protein
MKKFSKFMLVFALVSLVLFGTLISCNNEVKDPLADVAKIDKARLAPHADRGGGVLPYEALYEGKVVEAGKINADFVTVKDGEITITYAFDEMKDHQDESTDPPAPTEDKWLGTYFGRPEVEGKTITQLKLYVDGVAREAVGFAGDADFKKEFGEGNFKWFKATADGYEYVIKLEWLDAEKKVVAEEKAVVKYVNDADKVIAKDDDGDDD